MRKPRMALIALSLALAACGEANETAAPAPHSLSRDALGYYCSMIVVDHPGPKGQILLDGEDAPLWFSSVRDAVAFMRLPEEPKEISALYVSDMARAASWESPGDDNWIDGHQAWYVIDSAMTGGMGAPEAASFATAEAAEGFADSHGGTIVRLADIPDDYVLGAVDTDHRDMPEMNHGDMVHEP